MDEKKINNENKNPGAVDYFHRRIEDFDDIYRDDKRGLLPILNRYIRASVRIRFEKAFEIAGDLSGKSVLDIGCGSGRYMFKAYEKNASYIVGLDAAEGALEKARKLAAELRIENGLEFIQSDFLDCSFERKFDVVFAVGYFDYIFNPSDHLKKMKELSRGIIYASFPKRWNPLSATRKLRLALNGCPVRFYTRREIGKIMRNADIAAYEIHSIFRDYIVIIKI